VGVNTVIRELFNSIAVIAVGISLSASASSAALMYHVTDLRALPGGTNLGSSGFGINDYGQVVGTSGSTTGSRAFLWQPNSPNGITGSIIDVGSLTDSISGAAGINSSGYITGLSADPAGGTTAMLWSPTANNAASGSLTSIGRLSGNGAGGNSINSTGQVAGTGLIDSSRRHPFLWSPSTPLGASGTMVDLGLPVAADVTGFGQSINNLGQLVGYGSTSTNAGGTNTAFLWNPDTPNGSTGSMFTITAPNGSMARDATAINSAGQIVGSYSGGAYLWTPTTPNAATGSAIALGSFSALAVNDLDQVVGDSSFIWTPTDGLIDLNTRLDSSAAPGWQVQNARGINNLGQIVVNIFKPTGPSRGITDAALLTPTNLIPEPALGGLLLVGAVVIFTRRGARS
jgi:probable HAF family extracellular repeat protein